MTGDQQPSPAQPWPPGAGRWTRAEFVAFVRANHPDLGGDRAVFEAGLAQYRSAHRGVDRSRDETPPAAPGAAEAVEVVSVSPVQRWVDRIRRRYRRHRRTRVQ